MVPFKVISSLSHGETMGPFVVIGSLSHEQHWAHSRPSAVSSTARISPFMVIGSLSHEQHWAHSSSLAAFFLHRNGPIHGHRQAFSSSSAVFSLWTSMGPFVVISSFSHEKHWAHWWSLAAFLMNNIGPIQAHQ